MTKKEQMYSNDFFKKSLLLKTYLILWPVIVQLHLGHTDSTELLYWQCDNHKTESMSLNDYKGTTEQLKNPSHVIIGYCSGKWGSRVHTAAIRKGALCRADSGMITRNGQIHWNNYERRMYPWSTRCKTISCVFPLM